MYGWVSRYKFISRRKPKKNMPWAIRTKNTDFGGLADSSGFEGRPSNPETTVLSLLDRFWKVRTFLIRSMFYLSTRVDSTRKNPMKRRNVVMGTDHLNIRNNYIWVCFLVKFDGNLCIFEWIVLHGYLLDFEKFGHFKYLHREICWLRYVLNPKLSW